MPFQSQAQRRKFYAMASRGEISPKVVKEWEAHTPKDKKLPEHVEKKASAFTEGFEKEAFVGTILSGARMIGKGLGMGVMRGGRGLQNVGLPGVGRLIRQGGAAMAKNPGVTAGVGAGMVGAGMLFGGSDKQASAFEKGFEKQANIIQKGIKAIEEHGLHPAELTGLGVLAVPAVKHLATGKPMGEKAKDAYDVAGLGILAAPSVAHYAGKLFKH